MARIVASKMAVPESVQKCVATAENIPLVSTHARGVVDLISRLCYLVLWKDIGGDLATFG